MSLITWKSWSPVLQGVRQLTPSGILMERVNELRDPALFLDQGQVWIAYCGGGESGIGIAHVEGL